MSGMKGLFKDLAPVAVTPFFILYMTPSGDSEPLHAVGVCLWLSVVPIHNEDRSVNVVK